MDNIEIFKEIYRKYYKFMLNCAKRRMSKADAEDLAHKIVLKLMENSNWMAKIVLIADNTKKMKSALFVIIRNACNDYYRHIKNKDELFLDVPDYEIENIPNPEQQQNVDFLNRIIFYLNQLDEPNRTVFIKYYVEDYSKEELAEEFNLSLRALDSRLYRTLKEIRDKWGEKNIE
jgi:RNA polymerase sigma-70 factor (ECF subfamily)